MVKEIDCSILRHQLPSLFLRRVRDHICIRLLEKRFRSEKTDCHEQAGSDSPCENIAARHTRSLELSFETPELSEAWRAGGQVQPGRMIGWQPI
jgi:hypothetical protein